MGAGGILSNETVAGVDLVVGGVFCEEGKDGVGTGAGLGWVLVVAVMVEEVLEYEAVTREDEVLFKSTMLEVRTGLERATDTKPEVVVEVGAVVILEVITDAEEEGVVVTALVVDIVAGALKSTAAELGEGLKEVEVCRFKLIAASNLAGGGWVRGVRGLGVTAGGGGVATELGTFTEEIILGGSAISGAVLLTLEVRAGLIEGALTTVAGVFGGAVVVVEVELDVDLFVIREEDIIGVERLVIVAEVIEGFSAAGIGVDLTLMLVEVSVAEVESELSLTD